MNAAVILLVFGATSSPVAGRLHGAVDPPSRGLVGDIPEYCASEPDQSCYMEGWPACCADGGSGCPPERPGCDLVTTSTTTTFTTTTTTTEEPFQIPEQGPPPGDDPTGGAAMEAPPPPYCTSPSFDCYSEGTPACCRGPDTCISLTSPPCDVVTSTSSTFMPDAPDETMLPMLPTLTLPDGGLRRCNEVIPLDYDDDIIPKEVIQSIINAMLGDAAALMEGLVRYDVRARKVCTTCEEANKSWENAGVVMPYCRPGSFAHGRTMSGLLLEPIDPVTKGPIVGNVAATVYSFPTDTNPFMVPSQWPSDVVANPNGYVSGLFPASAGTYTLIPDVLGNGEDWEGVRSYIVKQVYQASAVPLLLKVKDDVEREYDCTRLDKRVNLMGFSEGGYATLSIALAIDGLEDGWAHAFTGVGGAPIKLASEQMLGFVKMHEGTFPLPQYLARLGNAYSSTNVDLANTDKGQNFSAEEYLDPDDETKDVREWSKAGLSYEEMLPYMPKSPPGSSTDMLNPDFLEMVLKSFEAGNHDPCNSEFKPESIDALCNAILDNDMSEKLSDPLSASFDYPVVICHSPDDNVIYYSNVPDTSARDNLVLIEDVPVVGNYVKPSGDHQESGAQCVLGFMLAFVPPPEISDVRRISPVEDGTCGEGPGANSTAVSSSMEGVVDNVPPMEGVAGNASSTISSPNEEVAVNVSTAGTNSTSLPPATSSGGGFNETAPSSSVVEAEEPTESPTPSPTEMDASAASAVSSLSSAVAAMAAASVFAAVTG